MILLIFLLVLGIVAMIAWNFLMFTSTEEHESKLAEHTHREWSAKLKELEALYHTQTEAIENAEGLSMRLFLKLFKNPASTEKKGVKLNASIEKLEGGNFNGMNFLILPGYSAIDRLGITADKKFFQEMIALFSDLKGREFAVDYSRHLLASMISCALGGTGVSLLLGVLLQVLDGDGMLGLILALGGPIFSVIIAYSLFTGLRSKAQKRREEIMSDFAQAVTEIALLTSSGMEMFRAWGDVCQNPERNGALFREMRQVSADIEYGAQPSAALEGFIRRCATKDTSRLGASILQNLTRGNEELSIFLTELSREAWEERKHTARQLGEQARSKLMLPMGLIFFGIMIMVGATVMVGMGGMGF
ncbi:MAG: type II secretion system F family protein [Defluviitaleaceae bacterium]|nr:type II secretion system F family protein [Defluviitaleaceae bacterium]